MKYTFKISRINNLFYYAQNMSEWSSFCKKEVNDYWKLKAGKLTDDEEKALKELRSLLKELGWKDWPEKYLLNDKKPYHLTEKHYSPVTSKKLKKSLENLSRPFEIIYNNQINNIKVWEKLLSKKLNKYNCEKDLYKFFEAKETIKSVIIYLNIFGQRTGGGANLKARNKISIRIGDAPLEEYEINKTLTVFFHEITHSLFSQELFSEIRKYLNKYPLEEDLMDIAEELHQERFLEEAVVNVVEKYIGIKHLNDKLVPDEQIRKRPDFRGAMWYLQNKYYKLVGEYIKNKKKFDEDFIKQMHQGYLDYLEFIKEGTPIK